MNLQHNQENK